MANPTFASKYGIYIQIAISLLYLLEALMATLLKAILVFYLRFEGKQTESRAIMAYHLFQSIAYFSAFFTGLIAMQSFVAALIVLLILYLLSATSLYSGFHIIPPGDVLLPFVIALFGLGNGALKSVIHRMMKVKILGRGCILISGALLLFEFLIHLLLPKGQNFSMSKDVILGLLGVVVFLLLLCIILSLLDSHDDAPYNLSEVVQATFYGLSSLIIKREKKAQKKDKKEKVRTKEHWMDISLNEFPMQMVQDLKQKFRLHKFYFPIIGLSIAVEIKYSFWVFSTYLTKRVWDAKEEIVVQPPQYLAIGPLIFLTFGPIFYFFLRPMLSKSFFHNSIRQMCLGGFILLIATGLGWRLTSMQRDLFTEFMEADPGHQKVRIVNAIDCPLGFQYSFPIHHDLEDIYHPLPALDITRSLVPEKKQRKKRLTDVQLNATQRERYQPKSYEIITNTLFPSLEDTFLKYANIKFLDKTHIGDVSRDHFLPADSFNFFMPLNSGRNYSVTLTTYGTCKPLDEYTLEVKKRIRKLEVDHIRLFMIENRKNVTDYVNVVEFPDVRYRRDLLQKPGVRLIVAFESILHPVYLYRNGLREASYRPAEKGLFKKATDPYSPIFWLKKGDGKNLLIKTMGQRFQFNYTLGTAEIVDILVGTRDDGVTIKLLRGLLPITISGWVPVSQFVILSFGEFLLGVVGLQALVAMAPERLRYHVQVDWFFLLGLSNLVILVVSQIGLPLIYTQMNQLSGIVGGSFVLLVVMAARY